MSSIPDNSSAMSLLEDKWRQGFTDTGQAGATIIVAAVTPQ